MDVDVDANARLKGSMRGLREHPYPITSYDYDPVVRESYAFLQQMILTLMLSQQKGVKTDSVLAWTSNSARGTAKLKEKMSFQ